MNINFEDIRSFVKGLTYDIENRAEHRDSFQHANNVRLYSENGILSLSSIKGTAVLYDNPAITLYLGGYAFKNELVMLAKYDNNYGKTIGSNGFYQYTVSNRYVTYPFSSSGNPTIGLDLEAGLIEEWVLYSEVEEDDQVLNIDKSNESCQTETGIFDISDYFRLSNIQVPNYESCPIEQDDITPENNEDISDIIIVLTKEDDGTFSEEIVWNGYLNLDPAKNIVMVGIDENAHYQRLYFTDSVNPLRTFNLKDPELIYKTAESFNMVQDIVLLQPEIDSINDDGVLTAMAVQYIYILITKNGQVSKYSPFSQVYRIVQETGKSDFQGGDIDRVTTKSVTINCPVPDYLKYDRIECIALEFEANAYPTSIKTLGIKDVSEVVPFRHTGAEQDFDTTVTLTEILSNTPPWYYCNTLEIHNNKLIPGGLRNKPYPIGVRYLEDQFVLRGWTQNGLTHSCLINPEPQNFKFIDPSNQDKYLFVIKRHYLKFLVYGNYTIKLTNTNTNAFIKKQFISTKDSYVNYMSDIYDWLTSEDLSVFPNLAVEKLGSTIMFKPEVETTITDLNDYHLSINNEQAIVEFDDEYSINTDSLNPSNLVNGAISQGFNTGNGIRLSWFVEDDLLLTKKEERYSSGPLLPLEAPTLKRGFMKEEIYRLAITFFKNGSPLFAIPMGDIQAPALGDNRTSIDAQGNKLDHFYPYVNQFVNGDKLYGQRLMLKAEVRVGCNLKKFVDAYQIQYVERTESNRTILAQGISAPLQRINNFVDINLSYEVKVPEAYRKWTLPYRGGPLHDLFGVEAYDTYGPAFEEDETNNTEVMKRRIITNRSLMYFDSPDLIYGQVSDALIGAANAQVLGRLKTDHSRKLLQDLQINQKDVDPFIENPSTAFSKKLYEGGQKEDDQLQNVFVTDDKKHNPYNVDVSVFSNYERIRATHEIDHFESVNNGLIIPAASMDVSHPVSNNALTMGRPSWYYSSRWRRGYLADGVLIGDWFQDTKPQMACEFGITGNRASGYSTVFLKTKTDLFTDELLGSERIMMPCNYRKGNLGGEKPATDSHALINLQLNNQETVYGGRTKYAFSRNTFIPLGKVTPIHKLTNQSQISKIGGDTYVSLYTRAKTTYHDHIAFKYYETIQNDDNRKNDSHDQKEYNRGGGWVYAVVLETQVEERLSHDYRFYRSNAPFDFKIELREVINPVYMITNSLKQFIPRPFNFKDDPLLTNTLAASKVKASGDYYDAFTVFPVNDFYEMPKKFGDISNIISDLDNLYVMQPLAVSGVTMDPKNTIRTMENIEVQVELGSGTVFHDHKVLSKYGTAIRGSVIKGEHGFFFYDERKNEFVKNLEALSSKHAINLQLREFFENDPVVEIEGWYDNKYKESNLLLVSKSNIKRVLSYNEALQVFNGYYQYDARQYYSFDDKVFAPKFGAENELHQLNKGDYLSLFGEQKNIEIGIVVHGQKQVSNIYKALTVKTNLPYSITKIEINDNLDASSVRLITGLNPKYKIKDGIHTLPLRNITDRAPKRGEWAYIKLTIESLSQNKVDVHKIITHLRKSII